MKQKKDLNIHLTTVKHQKNVVICCTADTSKKMPYSLYSNYCVSLNINNKYYEIKKNS